jgi:hypothetical protein
VRAECHPRRAQNVHVHQLRGSNTELCVPEVSKYVKHNHAQIYFLSGERFDAGTRIRHLLIKHQRLRDIHAYLVSFSHNFASFALG